MFVRYDGVSPVTNRLIGQMTTELWKNPDGQPNFQLDTVYKSHNAGLVESWVSFLQHPDTLLSN